jgi:protease-4
VKRILLSIGLLAAAVAVAPAAAPKPVVAVYDLEGVISESGSAPDSLLGGLSMESGRPLTFFELSASLRKAAGDPRVKAVVVDADGAKLGLAQLQELRRRLLAVRDAGKPIWMYTESLSNGTALLGSAATRFTLMPEANVTFNGIFAESMYYKGLLDKIGVAADVIHIGDFKSFGESFYRTGPSEFAQKQQDALIDSIFSQIVRQVAEGRKLEPAKVRELIDRGAMTAREAVDAGLADKLDYRTDFVAALRKKFGKDMKFDREYELPDLDGPDIKGVMDLLKLAFQQSKPDRMKKDHIAVVVLAGDISDKSIAPVRREILRCVKDAKAKALVLRVNSPGGSALASDVLWEATDEWKATGRPFAVSMGGVAASGGYYVSSDAARIFAEPGTVTGSIGVVGMKFVAGDALAKIGVTTHATKRGRHADLATMVRPYNDEERKLIRKSMLDVYGTFKKRVTDGRGARLKKDLEQIAGGRVFTGEQALEIGLVDELGGLTEAVAWVAKEAKLDPSSAVLRPAPKSPLEGLFSQKKKDDDEIIRAAAAETGLAIRLRAMIAASGLAETLPPRARLGLERLANRLSTFAKPQVLMLGPDIEIGGLD